jgi:protein gp37
MEYGQMSNFKTKIEWTDRTWSPITGCSKVSQGCKNCYAERWSARTRPGVPFTEIRLHPERLEQPLHWKKPCRIFVNSMSDLFHETLSFSFIAIVFGHMQTANWHTYQILTKRPKRTLEFFNWLNEEWLLKGDYKQNYPHVWLGVSVEDQKTADERIPILLQTPAIVRFVSYEPALGPVDFVSWLPYEAHRDYDGKMDPKLDWLICGGESGPQARPAHPDWFRSVRDQCQDAGVPFFMKQITERGRKVPFEQFPKDLQIREFPNAQR